ncbi:hypothetical protein GGR53DRAFT_523378 [Hypoxylon sp. FL1150]|nr:hypothetical protein GGR53DRAFT_523378 [Hypoxylon sp. FL1150]
MAGTSDAVETEIGYFSRNPRYNTEKPYITSFPVDDIPGAKVNNHEWVYHKTTVEDVRGKSMPSLDTQGFQYIDWKTNISRSDFELDETIGSRYYGELAEMIRQFFPRYKKLAFFDYAIRKRDRYYPANAAQTKSQPLRFAHSDFTEKGARTRLMDALGREAEERLKTRCDILNVWRLLNTSPTSDWPLAFCDWRTVNQSNDLIENDVVYAKSVGENQYLRHNPDHKWWFLAGQKPDEVVVFRNVSVGDSSAARMTPFLLESIEVRLAAFN